MQKQPELFQKMNRSVVWGKGLDGSKLRYVLSRVWDQEKLFPQLMFIGLNPSTADDKQDDPTIRRVISFAKNWGYGGVNMLNLFAYITAYPEKLKITTEEFAKTDWWLKEVAAECDKIVFAWGAFKVAKQRADQVIKMFPGAWCLGKTAAGDPRHPLFVRGDTQLEKF